MSSYWSFDLPILTTSLGDILSKGSHLICLSATVANPDELAGWIDQVTGGFAPQFVLYEFSFSVIWKNWITCVLIASSFAVAL